MSIEYDYERVRAKRAADMTPAERAWYLEEHDRRLRFLFITTLLRLETAKRERGAGR